jgi:hemerythrin-like metal-binding protein
MSKIDWTESLSVKIDSIDAQHKKLIGLTNSFYENLSKGSPREKMIELIKALKDYTVYHFALEEKQLQQVNYSDFKNHKMEHDKFVATVLNFEERYKAGKLLLTLEVTNFINEWIVNHIMVTDRKYSELLIRKGIH